MRSEFKTHNISPYEVQQLRRTMSLKEIAAIYNISTRGLQWWAQRHNVILKRVTDWEIAEGIQAKTPKELAYQYNVTTGTIYSRLKTMGISAKQNGQKKGGTTMKRARLTDLEIAKEIGTKTVKQIAAEHKMTPAAIYHRLAKLGMCPKQPGQAGGR